MIKRLFGFGRKTQLALEKSNFAFLVIGAGRGGTSLLAGMLDNHNKLEVGFERFAVSLLMGQKVKSEARTLYQTRTDHFIKACIQEASRFPNKLWGNKITTEQLYALEEHNTQNPENPIDVMDTFFNHNLGGVKVLFILRDGRTCVRSKMARTGQSLELACERWLYSVQVYRFLQDRHTNNLRIKFEDLLTNPEKISKDICRFLNVEFSEIMLEGVGNPKMLPEYRQKGFDTSKLNVDDIPPGAADRIRAGLAFCGYL